MKFQLIITDSLGTHVITENDCVYKCTECEEEMNIRKTDIVGGKIKMSKPHKCGGEMQFRYWLDGVYTDEQLDEMENAIK